MPQGYLVNLRYIREVVSSGGTFEILLKTGDKVLLSREKEKELREKFKYNSMN
ncbi:LytTR family transcriptional regulator DNA-binding domain-containing protein [Thermincola ferriacetica]|uniref:LytTR family transcriptional regulator DNA-binding domain-containing protein n=1 Tax=Thermincola TaxID=278993 RepID=UPI0002E0DF93